MQDKIDNLKLLKSYKGKISKHQYKTFKGQILSGNISGFRKGLFNLIKEKSIKETKSGII